MEAINDFVTSWNQFLDDLVQAARLKAESKGQAAYRDDLIPLLEVIVRDLKEDNSYLRVALQGEIDEDKTSESVLRYLRKEFTFFEKLIKQVKTDQEEDNDDDGVDDAIDAGKTIKDSFEKLIKKLPERWRKILKVLNEILNLLKKGT